MSEDRDELGGGPIAPSSSVNRPLRVVSLAHSGMQCGSGRLRYEWLARSPDVDLTLIVPDRWREYGRELKADPSAKTLDLRVQAIRWRRVGSAGWYMHHYKR